MHTGLHQNACSSSFITNSELWRGALATLPRSDWMWILFSNEVNFHDTQFTDWVIRPKTYDVTADHDILYNSARFIRQ